VIGRIGPPEMILILGVLLLIFGPSKLPDLAKSIGKSVTELKDGLSGKADSSENAAETESSQESSS